MNELLEKVSKVAKIQLCENDTAIDLEFYDVSNINSDYFQILTLELRENKSEVIQLLKYIRSDRFLEKAEIRLIEKGYMGNLEAEVYQKQITRNSHLYIQKLEDQDTWTAYRITYGQDGGIRAEKIIAENMNILEVLRKAERYMERYLSFIQKQN